MRFGDMVRNLRIQYGWSQMDLAKKLGTSQAAITAWETGKRSPDFASVKKVADIFNLPIEKFTMQELNADETSTEMIINSISKNPKLRMLFDRSKLLDDKDLDAILRIVISITGEREN